MFEINSPQQVPKNTIVLSIAEVIQKNSLYTVKLDCYTHYGMKKELILEGKSYVLAWENLFYQFSDFIHHVEPRSLFESIILLPFNEKRNITIKNNTAEINALLLSLEFTFRVLEAKHSCLFIDEEVWFHLFDTKPDFFDKTFDFLNILAGCYPGNNRTCSIAKHEDLWCFNTPLNNIFTLRETAPVHIKGCIEWLNSKNALVKYHKYYGGKVKWLGCSECDDFSVVVMDSTKSFVDAVDEEDSFSTLTNDKLLK